MDYEIEDLGCGLDLRNLADNTIGDGNSLPFSFPFEKLLCLLEGKEGLLQQ